MQISDVFRSFTNAIADIELYRASTETAADRELRHLLEQKKVHEQMQWADLPSSSHGMFFPSATSGQPIFYGHRQLTIEDEIRSLVRHTNRQHQWFLAEAYELFEEFVKRAYACMGLQSPHCWPLRDFGAIRWGAVKEMDYAWFLEQTRSKKDAPLSMLRQFREVLPRLKHVEANKRLDCDLLVAVTLIGQMRHRIVHARGIVPDKAEFADEVLRKLGYSGASKNKPLEFINYTLLLSTDDSAIHLLKVPHPDSAPPIRVTYDVFDGLVRYLLMYAHETYLSLGGPLTTRFDVP